MIFSHTTSETLRLSERPDSVPVSDQSLSGEKQESLLCRLNYTCAKVISSFYRNILMCNDMQKCLDIILDLIIIIF